MTKHACIAAWVIAVIIATTALRGDTFANLPGDPEKAQFVYTDLENFIAISERLETSDNLPALLETHYFNPGSDGLKVFVKKYDLSIQRLASAIRKRMDEYTEAANILAYIQSQEPKIRAAFLKLKSYIPGIVYPPTYFLIGAYRGIGSGSEAGQLITVEKWGRDRSHPIEVQITHELVHLNQVMCTGIEKYRAIYGPEKTLLALCIREGIAEFFTYLATGRITQEQARIYVKEHQFRLWEQFRREMLEPETGDWMWKKPQNPEQPMHTGYAIGFWIAKSYYDAATDKISAVREMLEVVDYPDFLKKSGYMSD